MDATVDQQSLKRMQPNLLKSVNRNHLTRDLGTQ